ncbi:MAG: ferritin family protein [Spirochaetales bacterium]|nr:ferritin family protein [Spirochaetales bacterium]
MDIFDFGMKMEQEGEQYYRENARKIEDENASQLIFFLANEENRHYQLIKHLKEGCGGVLYTRFVKDVKTIFKKMKEKGESFVEEKSGMMDILNGALRMEQESIDFYRTESEKTDNPEARELLRLLKKEEDAHYSLVSSLIEFYETPHLWLEQAEFTHLTDY